jgi:hypothetical protein
MRWYRCDPQELMAELVGLDFADQGAYLCISNVIFSRDGNILDDDRLVSRMIGCDVRQWRAAKSRLISLGKVSIVDGKVTSILALCWLNETSMSRHRDEKHNEISGRKSPLRTSTITSTKKEEVDSMKVGDSPTPPLQVSSPSNPTSEYDFESDDGEVRFSADEIEKLVDRFPFIKVRPQLRHLTRDWPDIVGNPHRKQMIVSALETKNAKGRDRQAAEAKGKRYSEDRATGRLANPDYIPGKTDEFGRKPLWERGQLSAPRR